MTGELVARYLVAASAAGLLVAAITVLALERRSQRPDPVERDTGPLALVNFVGILGFFAIGLATSIWMLGTLSLSGWMGGAIRVAGILSLGLAGFLAAWGLRSIGRQMSSQAEVRPDTELVTNGAFRVVRHPLYLSILLLWAGAALAIGSWFMAACTTVLVPLFVARSRLEERMLMRHLGGAYGAYAARVPMLVPAWPRRRSTEPDGPAGHGEKWRQVMAGVHLEAADERSADVIARVVWGLLLVWTGAVVLLSWGWGIGFLGAGAILLAAQVVRRRFGLKLETFGLAAGALFLLCGAVTLFRVGVDLFPLVCIVAGVALLLSTWSARTRHESGGPTELHAPSHPRG